jgi:hypothetical protein
VERGVARARALLEELAAEGWIGAGAILAAALRLRTKGRPTVELVTKDPTKTHSTLEARTAYVMQRAGGLCEFRTGACTGTAVRVLVEAPLIPLGLGGAPAYGLRAVCESCFTFWAR